MALDTPEPGARYQVGVHYWDDHGHGPSWATLCVYVYGMLAFELTDIELTAGDLWEVATIDGLSGEVTLVIGRNGNYRTTPGVVRPSFPFKP